MPKASQERVELMDTLESVGYNKDDFKGKSLKQLQTMVDEYNEANQTLEVMVESDEDEMQDSNEGLLKKMSSPEWTDYVLGLMDEHEKDNGHPKVDGLRRIALKLLGIFEVQSFVKQVPNDANSERATVTVSVTFKNQYPELTYSGSADVNKSNTAREFANHPTATAETRAEGRALRRALFLTKVLAAEETYNADPQSSEAIDTNISPALVNTLKVVSDRANINPVNLALSQNFEIEEISELTKKQGQHLINVITKYTTKELDLPEYVKVDSNV